MTIANIRKDAKHTLYACYLAIMGQAVVNNFVPLLLITFEGEFGLSLSDIAVLVGFNFFVQLVTDFIAAHRGQQPPFTALYGALQRNAILLPHIPNGRIQPHLPAVQYHHMVAKLAHFSQVVGGK